MTLFIPLGRTAVGRHRDAVLYSGRHPHAGTTGCPPSMTDSPPGSTANDDAGSADRQRIERLNQLLARAAAGDQQAFEALYRATSSRVFGVITKMMRDRGEAEDLLQDVYVSAWRRADTFDADRGSAITWLIALARNRTIDRMRQHREELLGDDAVPDIADDAPTPAAMVESAEERLRLQRCLERLEPTQRHAIREAFFTGATYHELAQRVAVPLGTMKSWIRRSLMQLKTCLEQ
jgi:RNA polymerase sigma factor (sigma-70 family)